MHPFLFREDSNLVHLVCFCIGDTKVITIFLKYYLYIIFQVLIMKFFVLYQSMQQIKKY